MLKDRRETKTGIRWQGEERERGGQKTETLELGRVEGPHPAAWPHIPASPAQCGVVLIAAPATLVALQTLVAGQEAVTAPAPGL